MLLAPEGNAGSAAPSADGGAAAAETASEDRLSLVVFFDNSNLRPENRARVLGQLRDFLGKEVGPKDQVMIVTHSLGLQVRLPFTSDTAKIQALLDQIEKLPATGGEADSARRQALTEISSIRDLSGRETRSGQLESPCAPRIVHPVENYARSTREEVIRSLAATKVLVNSLSGLPGRKALLHVSDGLPLTPGEEVYQVLFEICGGGSASSGASGGINVQDGELLDVEDYKGRQALMDAQRFSTAKDFGQLAAHANANRVTLYTLQATGLRGAAAASAAPGPDERLLQLPAVGRCPDHEPAGLPQRCWPPSTGGRAILDANDIRGDLAPDQEDLGTYYSLATPRRTPATAASTASRSGSRSPACRSATARATATSRPSRRPWTRPSPRSTTASRRTRSASRSRSASRARAPTGSGQYRSSSASRCSRLFILTQQDKSYEGKLWLLVAARDTKGGDSPMRQVEVPIRSRGSSCSRPWASSTSTS